MYRGLIDLLNDDALLSGVIAHEIAHVVGRDKPQKANHPLTRLGALFALQNFHIDSETCGGKCTSFLTQPQSQAVSDRGLSLSTRLE